MKIGLFAPLANPFATPEYIRLLGPAAEERGFHSIWVGEHVVLFDEYASTYPYAADGRVHAPSESGLIDPFAALSFLAATTRTVRLGTGICLVPQRNPVYTRKRSPRSTTSPAVASTSASASAGWRRSSRRCMCRSRSAARAVATISS